MTELLAENAATLPGPGGDHPDWVEVHNPNGSAVNLDGWTATDRLAEPGRHTFGELWIGPDVRLLLFADDHPERGPHHLAFQLDADGEAFALHDPLGRAVDGLRFGPQVPDVALVLTDTGWTYAAPTPTEP